MVPDKKPGQQKTKVVRYNQRYFKVTPKGRAPKVTRVWKVEEKPWYIRYAYDWMLLLIAVPFLVARAWVPNNGWTAFGLEYILIGIFFMWLVTLPPGEHER
jgi:hypothetical protein